MNIIVLTIHVVVCLLLILLVLLQPGKDGMGVVFGGGNSSVFGSSGAGGFLTKLTALLAIVFIVTSLSYNVLSTPPSAMDETLIQEQQADPVPFMDDISRSSTTSTSATEDIATETTANQNTVTEEGENTLANGTTE